MSGWKQEADARGMVVTCGILWMIPQERSKFYCGHSCEPTGTGPSGAMAEESLAERSVSNLTPGPTKARVAGLPLEITQPEGGGRRPLEGLPAKTSFGKESEGTIAASEPGIQEATRAR